MGGDGLGLGRSRGSVVARCRVTTLKRRVDRRVDQDRVLAVDLEHAAPLAQHPHRLEDALRVEPEVEHHERLAVATPASTIGRQLGDRVVHPARDRQAQPVVDGRVRLASRVRHSRIPASERAFRGRRRAGARVVEREERRRAAERRGHGILEEAVGLGVRGDPRVGVDVDRARQDEETRRVDDLASRGRRPVEIGLDRLDDRRRARARPHGANRTR